MASLRHQKEMEQKVHDQLYTNLYLLTTIYPATKEFNAIFTKDMFVRNNKAAFFEVIYYLLNAIDARLVKEKLVNWPPYNAKTESKCRSDILSCIDVLNARYENADIPVCQASSLISPGGFRFAKFMLKISQLVLYEHLRKSTGDDLLCRLKTVKTSKSVTTSQLSDLRKVTDVIEAETKRLCLDFKDRRSDLIERACRIDENLSKLSVDMKKAQSEYEIIEKEFKTKYLSADSVMNKLSPLNIEIERIKRINSLLSECQRLVTCLKTVDFKLEHVTSDLDVGSCVNDRGELDLNEYFREVCGVIEKQSLRLPNLSNTFLAQTKDKVQNLSVKYEEVSKKFQSQRTQLQNLIRDLQTMFKEAANY